MQVAGGPLRIGPPRWRHRRIKAFPDSGMLPAADTPYTEDKSCEDIVDSSIGFSPNSTRYFGPSGDQIRREIIVLLDFLSETRLHKPEQS